MPSSIGCFEALCRSSDAGCARLDVCRGRRAARGSFLKREDLAHTGAQKINNALGQRCSPSAWANTDCRGDRARDSTASRRRPPARCSAWSATCTWGAEDMDRQALKRVFACALLGAEVCRVDAGSRTLKDRDQRSECATGEPNVGTRIICLARCSARIHIR